MILFLVSRLLLGLAGFLLKKQLLWDESHIWIALSYIHIVSFISLQACNLKSIKPNNTFCTDTKVFLYTCRHVSQLIVSFLKQYFFTFFSFWELNKSRFWTNFVYWIWKYICQIKTIKYLSKNGVNIYLYVCLLGCC